MKVSDFGTIDDQKIKLYTLTNQQGMEVQITNYGGIIKSIKVPDRAGKFENVTLGFDNFPSYLNADYFFGALIGRYGNRIAYGKFSLNGDNYILATNNGSNHLHGGNKGFDKVIWAANEKIKGQIVGVQLTYMSKDMEEGYPGNLEVIVHYWLTNENELKIHYKAKSDKTTICNLTNHAYFNLAGKDSVLNHELMINADYYTPVDKTLIPTGKLEKVEGSPFDFRTAKPILSQINENHSQLKIGNGYDHNFVLNKKSKGLELAASLYEPNSGRFMEVFTEEPGIQFYTSNFLDCGIVGSENKIYTEHYAVCLETQHFPDSPNQADFPSITLNAGELYETTTIYKFSVKA